jgi:TonB family protein
VRPQIHVRRDAGENQGVVALEVEVRADGTVGNAWVVRSLDPTHGLDEEAIKAAKQWRFAPAMKNGQPVTVIIPLDLTFTLR